MDFLKKLFSGGGGSSDTSAMYFYVQPKGCDEIIRVRVDRNNDLSINDDEGGYWVRKLARGTSYKCMQVELQLFFDLERRLSDSEVSGGTPVSEKEYRAWVETQKADS